MRLVDKIALITGGAGIIGTAAAKRLVDEGAKVILVDSDPERVEAACRQLPPGSAHSLVADVTSPTSVAACAERAAAIWGPLDIFLNNAGIEGPTATITDYPVDAFERVMAVNVIGVFLGMKYVLPKMRDGGSVVITSSVAGLGGSPSFVGYVTSKHAVIGIMRTAALDVAGRGIRVNTVHPAMVESPMMRRIEASIEGEVDAGGVRAHFQSRIPLGRYIEPSEVADMMVFLASDESRMVTGATFTVDGGFTA